MNVKIGHPMANKISIQNSPWHYCGEGTSEIAFFMNNEWVTKVISEFADYSDGAAGDTLVYGYVPNDLIDEFLDNYRLA